MLRSTRPDRSRPPVRPAALRPFSEINVTPLIGVLLVLLIVLLMAVPVAQPGRAA